MNKRTREIIYWMMDKKEYGESCTIADLIHQFHVSERTIRYDLDDIRLFLLENKVLPLQFEGHGAILLQEDRKTMFQLLNKHDFYSFKLAKEERQDMMKYLIVLATDCITLQQMADILFVSRSTIIHDIEEVKKQMMTYEVEVVSLRKGICACGRESMTRILLLSLLRNSFIRQYWKNDTNQVFMGQDERVLINIIKDVETQHHRFLTDGSFEDVKHYFIIMIERYHKYKYVEIDYVSVHTSMSNMANDMIHKMSAYFGIECRLQEEYLLADILYNMHFLQRNDADEKTMQIQVVSKQFIDAITTDLNVDLRNDFQFYQNLTNHLQSTFKDIELGDCSEMNVLTEVMKNNTDVVCILRKHIQPLEHYVKRHIREEEIAYITMHVCAAMERNKQQGQQFTILLLCNSGIGTSQLLLTRLKKYFQLYVIDVIPVHALASYDVTGIDLIISTIPIKEIRCAFIILHPFLSDEDCILLGEKLAHLKTKSRNMNSNPSFQRMQTMIANSISDSPLDKDEIYKNIIKDLQAFYFPIAPSEKAMLRELLTVTHIQLDVVCKDWKEAVKRSSDPLLKEGYLTTEYVRQMIRNIDEMGPYIVIAQGFALPHESPDMGGKRLGMNLIRLKQPVSFRADQFDPVEFVCCLSTIDKDSHLKAMFHLMNLLAKPDFCEQIRKAKSASELHQILYEFEAVL